MKRDIHLLHEYLADEGTLNSGVETITYQSMLINQVAEEHLVVIPSSFNNNNLKKRLIMMTQKKNDGHNGLLRRKFIPL
jgi:beta-lactamase regulating signal transducer with metallopeptidase domain